MKRKQFSEEQIIGILKEAAHTDRRAAATTEKSPVLAEKRVELMPALDGRRRRRYSASGIIGHLAKAAGVDQQATITDVT